MNSENNGLDTNDCVHCELGDMTHALDIDNYCVKYYLNQTWKYKDVAR